MQELCSDFLVINPYSWLRNACIIFTDKIQNIYVRKGVKSPSRDEVGKSYYLVITHGIASAHTHLGLYPIRSSVANGLDLDGWVKFFAWPWEKYLRKNPRLTYINALISLEELVKSGVTAFADMHFNEDHVGSAVQKIGVKGDLSIALMDGGVFENFEEGLQENLDLVNKFRSSKLINTRLGPCTLRLLTPKQFREVVELAKELGVGIHTHLAEVIHDLTYLAKVWDMNLRGFIEYVGLRKVDSLVAHGIWTASVVDEFFNSSNIHVIHSPRSNTLLGDGKFPLLAMLSEGIRIALGVDVAPTYSLIDDMNFALALHYQGLRPLSPELIFSLGSEGGYRALGFGSGDLVVGEPADIVVWKVRKEIFTQPISSIVLGNAKVSEVYVNGESILSGSSLRNISPGENSEIRNEFNNYLNDFIKNHSPYSLT